MRPSPKSKAKKSPSRRTSTRRRTRKAALATKPKKKKASSGDTSSNHPQKPVYTLSKAPWEELVLGSEEDEWMTGRI